MTDLDRCFDENVCDLNAILHPGSVFDHPRDVLADTTLSRAEKRAILASWASDVAAVTSCPSLRAIPGAKSVVPIDDILEALSSLDYSPRTPPGGKPARLKSTDNRTTMLNASKSEGFSRQCLSSKHDVHADRHHDGCTRAFSITLPKRGDIRNETFCG